MSALGRWLPWRRKPAAAPSGSADARASEAPGAGDRLVIYTKPWCLYCRHVSAVVGELGVEVEYRDVRADPAHRRELVEAMGRGTVPVLRVVRGAADGDGDGDFWLPESREIARWLRERYGS